MRTSAWRILLTNVMEHSDDKLVEYFDDNGMEHCDGIGMEPFRDRVQGTF